VFSNCIHSPEFTTLLVAEDADISDGDLFAKVSDETGKVDEVLCVGNEERMGVGHVCQVIFEGGRLLIAEET